LCSTAARTAGTMHTTPPHKASGRGRWCRPRHHARTRLLQHGARAIAVAFILLSRRHEPVGSE
jgi:hypothetical protein